MKGQVTGKEVATHCLGQLCLELPPLQRRTSDSPCIWPKLFGEVHFMNVNTLGQPSVVKETALCLALPLVPFLFARCLTRLLPVFCLEFFLWRAESI